MTGYFAYLQHSQILFILIHIFAEFRIKTILLFHIALFIEEKKFSREKINEQKTHFWLCQKDSEDVLNKIQIRFYPVKFIFFAKGFDAFKV